MLTRRGFTGFASCALCAITGFIATDASAQGTAPAPSGGVEKASPDPVRAGTLFSDKIRPNR